MPTLATSPEDQQHHDQLTKLVHNTPWLMAALRAAQSLGLASWCIGAGAVRNLVWDTLHGLPSDASTLRDLDLVYFDANHLEPAQQQGLQDQLQALAPHLPWEVSNQAAVHLWYAQHFGHAVAPLRSLHEAVASWPEYATAVGVYMDANSALRVIAPYGLHDLFTLQVRHNPLRATAAHYRQRIAQKRYQQRWPKLQIAPA